MKKFPRKVVVEQIAALVAAISNETLEEVQGGVSMHAAYGVSSPAYDDLEPTHRRGPLRGWWTAQPKETVHTEGETDAAGKPTE